MTHGKPGTLAGTQAGFALIELLVAVAIAAIMAGAISSTIWHIVTVSAMDRGRMEVVKQVENALHWINRDGQQAWVSLTPPATDQPFTTPLVLHWTDNDASTHDVSYYSDPADPENRLQRIESIDGGPATVGYVARHIDLAESMYSFNGQTVSVRIKAAVSGIRPESETRTLTVIPRASR